MPFLSDVVPQKSNQPAHPPIELGHDPRPEGEEVSASSILKEGLKYGPMGIAKEYAKGVRNLVGPEVVDASFRIDSDIGSFLAEQRELTDQEFDRNFNLTDKLMENNIPKHEWEDYTSVFNDNAFEQMRAHKARQLEDRKIISDAGALGTIASMGMGIISPFNLIGGGGAAAAAVKAGKSVTKVGLLTSAASIPSMVGSEMALQATQTERELSESALNVGAGAVLSGLIGSGATALGRSIMGTKVKTTQDAVKLKQEIKKEMREYSDQDFMDFITKGKPLPDLADDSVGSARVKKQWTAEMSKLVSNPVFDLFIKATKGISASARGMGNSNREIREAWLKMFNRAFDVEGDAADEFGISIEDMVNSTEYKKVETDAAMAVNKAWKSYRKRADSGEIQKLSVKEFNDQVYLHADDGTLSGIKEIDEAVTASHKYDEFMRGKERETGYLDSSQNKSHKGHTFNRDAILADEASGNRHLFKAIENRIHQQYSDAQVKAKARVDELNAKEKLTDREDNELNEILRDLDVDDVDDLDAYISDLAEQKVSAILNKSQTHSLNRGTLAREGLLKNTKLDIRARDIIDFLDTNIERSISKKTRLLVPRMETYRKFGTDRWADIEEDLRAQHADNMKGIRDVKQIKKMTKEFEQSIKDMKHLHKNMLGQNVDKIDPDGAIAQALHFARTLAYTTMLGRVVVNSLGDPARVVAQQGFQGYTPMAAKMVKLVTADPELKAKLREDASYMGSSLEVLSNERAFNSYRLNDYTGSKNILTRGMDTVAAVSTKAFGIAHWNDFMKQIVSLATHFKIVDTLVSGKPITDKQAKYLDFLGLSKDMQSKIKTELLKHGEELDSKTPIANYGKWKSNVRSAYLAAIKKEADLTIITPNISDTPIITQNSVGRSITQFLSFAFASHNKAFGKLLQDPDANRIMGSIINVKMGMAIGMFQDWEKGKDPTKRSNLEILNRGLDKSGLFSLMYLGYDLASTAVGKGAYGKKFTDVVGGPSGSLGNRATRLWGVGENAIDPDKRVTQGQWRVIRSLIPMQNAWFINAIGNRGQEYLFKEYKVPKRNKRKKKTKQKRK